MNLPYRIDLLTRLGEYIFSADPAWKMAKEKSGAKNGWFIPEFVDLATENIARHFLQKNLLEQWTDNYKLPVTNQKKIGVIMAGNIPLVGFHDFLSVFISGHQVIIKTSSNDRVLIKHLAEKLAAFDPDTKNRIQFEDMLKGCDAYIATGSTNSSRYFEYYFGKYPHIIRKNKTSIALLSGNETASELEALADDVYLYFGLGCRNVTKVFVPAGYDFIPLLNAFNKYHWLTDHHKYKNNYDYNLALHILNNKYYMTNGSILLVEDPNIFSPISQLNYEFYRNKNDWMEKMSANPDIQCIVGEGFIPFGMSQCPSIKDYADGADTLQFLCNL